jgi:hypothetical protein
VDHSPVPGWSADWEIEDRLHYLPAGARVGLRYTDLTPGAEAFTCEGWIVVGGYEVNEEVWIPRLMVRRRAEASAGAPLASTFVAVIEPHDGESRIASIRRLPLVTADGRPYADSNVAIEVGLADGRADLFISADAENALGLRPSLAADTVLVQKDWGIRLEGELCLARRNAAGGVDSTVACGGRTSTLS